ncbi:exodeoxyribonuclease VII large subunit [Rubellicoccus peritrichatus]|uniref:Exodeoxyribonuclease 7 large subunit n=1 Tax=Rubellicoccus peritrichatus TaxID=3080537 RepID=A0AAQ3QXE2_9BACT|nr:exodeoxyribonuclease VII large subunit [Puniceicoccus sp. CR14]WOO42962.1 exodeoxyribonuclease VII large subunit [Puniceicoccus sp. CR14]
MGNSLLDPVPPNPEHVLAVGDFTRRIKDLLEGGLPACWVRGEVSNLRKQQSGHIYFTLKDRESQLPCVMFRGDAMRQSVDMADGQQLIVHGAISVYEPHGRYQLICRELVEDGAGRLQQEFERLKKKLADEGLFSSERKKPIPVLPKTVAFVTSPTGAAIRDFLSIMKRRSWCGRIIILPAKVQGVGASDEIVERIQDAQAIGDIDLLVVGRGGGSLEDLWCFNEEKVARSVAACSIPTISAVGHEIDFTLSDFAADKRAETPSAAAELISSAYLNCSERVAKAADALIDAPAYYFERRWSQVGLLAERMRSASPERRIEQSSLRLDDLASRLTMAAREHLHERSVELGNIIQRLHAFSPERRIELARLQLKDMERRFNLLIKTSLTPKAERLAAVRHRLENASLHRTLARGFVVARDAKGELVTRKAGLSKGDTLAIDFADGEVHTEVKAF